MTPRAFRPESVTRDHRLVFHGIQRAFGDRGIARSQENQLTGRTDMSGVGKWRTTAARSPALSSLDRSFQLATPKGSAPTTRMVTGAMRRSRKRSCQAK